MGQTRCARRCTGDRRLSEGIASGRRRVAVHVAGGARTVAGSGTANSVAFSASRRSQASLTMASTVTTIGGVSVSVVVMLNLLHLNHRGRYALIGAARSPLATGMRRGLAFSVTGIVNRSTPSR